MQPQTNTKNTNGVPLLRRSEWASHSNYPRQALLLSSHESFRNISSHLVKETMRAWSEAPGSGPRAVLSRLFWRWKSAMKSHEGYEEGKLYPYLRAKYGVSFAVLELHHRNLGLAEDRVRLAERNGDALQFAHAIKKHDEILVPHLAQEEEMVIPLLLSLEPDEFDRYSNGHIASLLRELASEEEA